ncbi:sulfatase-like hydrolase/transferase [Halocatena marina]|uniref:Sulfatase-like hydrolase/transferase n=1 Tax=Halocatena marina TaxID=2934937 RepID=A0ABD5YQQ0_9EURY
MRWNHQTEEQTIRELDPPFVHFIHDVGPHAPYGYDNTVWDSTESFFSAYPEPETLRKLYAKDCENSAERFLSVLEYLREEGLLDETLVVYTSDHGQCLGETHHGGQFGHVDPMCPELVYIPITFIGAGLPAGQDYDGLLSASTSLPPYSLRRAVKSRTTWTGNKSGPLAHLQTGLPDVMSGRTRTSTSLDGRSR